MEPILVTGGTGTLGRHVVRRLCDAGADVRVLTRKTQDDQEDVRFLTGDLMSDSGVDAAVDGVGTIVHLAGGPKGDEIATQHLVNAATRSGRRPHLVFVSVVGADRIPVRSRTDRMLFRYFDMKRKAELVVERSGLPWTTVRASQFYDLVLFVAEKVSKLPVAPMPSRTSFQPVDSDEVAERMVELALGEPSGLVDDIAGPRVYLAADLLRAYFDATGRRKPVLQIHLPGGAARALRGGAATAPAHSAGKRTWEEFLADRVGPATSRP